MSSKALTTFKVAVFSLLGLGAYLLVTVLSSKEEKAVQQVPEAKDDMRTDEEVENAWIDEAVTAEERVSSDSDSDSDGASVVVVKLAAVVVDDVEEVEEVEEVVEEVMFVEAFDYEEVVEEIESTKEIGGAGENASKARARALTEYFAFALEKSKRDREEYMREIAASKARLDAQLESIRQNTLKAQEEYAQELAIESANAFAFAQLPISYPNDDRPIPNDSSPTTVNFALSMPYPEPQVDQGPLTLEMLCPVRQRPSRIPRLIRRQTIKATVDLDASVF